MYPDKEAKAELFKQHSPRGEAKDTGSVESQVALFTTRIAHLTEHLKRMPKDKKAQYGLLKLVGQRRKMLAYLQKKDINRYRALIKALNLRG